LWQIFTDGSKSEQGVGSGVAIFTVKVLTEQLKFKLDDRCTNNQAEQLAIVKALEVIETQQLKQNEHGTAVIYTDSRITLDAKRSAKNHNHIVEGIRKRAVNLYKKNWTIEFKWVKAHAGIYGNEIADRIAKEATQNYYVNYSRTPKKRYKKGYPERKYKKMAKSMGGNNERSDY
jgi:ribonuclease HI